MPQEPSKEQETPVELVGTDGARYRFRPFSPAVYEALHEHLEGARLDTYLSAARRHRIGLEQQARTIGEMTRHPIAPSDVFDYVGGVPGMLFILELLGRPHQSDWTAARVRDLFLPILDRAFRRLDETSDRYWAERNARVIGEYDALEEEGDVGRDGVDPTMS